ncbi:hypothetical protein M422DRAFT_775501 [Sphaerobolus stellatus SS14]|nr:hypothetical protein M422DRAFT_775501 [Sphaerobolus stellatus SS14]
MPITRSQSARTRSATATRSKQTAAKPSEDAKHRVGSKRTRTTTGGGRKRPAKRVKTERKEDFSVKKEQEEKPLNGVLKNNGEDEAKKEDEEPKQVTFKKEVDVHLRTPTDEKFQKQFGILERGHIYFFYRPKVGKEDVEDVDDIANFSFLLVPRPPKEDSKDEYDSKDPKVRGGSAAPEPAPQTEPNEFFRYIVMGKKHFPKTESKHEVFWASVVDVGEDVTKLDEGLSEQVYQTKTRGERHKGAARVAGRGVYAIVTPTNMTLPLSRLNRTYLTYILTHPAEPTSLQASLGIESQSSFLIQVKNPEQSSRPGVGLRSDKRAKYSEEAKEEAFGGVGGKGVEAKKFSAANPVTLMDYQGAELLIIGDKKNVDDILGEEGSNKEMERAAIEDTESLDAAHVMKELVLDAKKFPPDALRGDWV